jgi:hypothetical protein
MAMTSPSQYGNGDSTSRFCIYCTDQTGKLKARNEIRAGMIEYTMKLENWPRERAKYEVDRLLAGLPAWPAEVGRLSRTQL